MNISLFEVYLNDYYYGWGISFLKFTSKEMKSYSLFEFAVRKSNISSRGSKFIFDFLFLNPYIELYYDKLNEKSFWNKDRLTLKEKLIYKLLNTIYG